LELSKHFFFGCFLGSFLDLLKSWMLHDFVIVSFWNRRMLPSSIFLCSWVVSQINVKLPIGGLYTSYSSKTFAPN
jgi:hypothetical protein